MDKNCRQTERERAEIMMRVIRDGLSCHLKVQDPKGNPEWTEAVKTKLCEIGQDRFGYEVCASGVENPKPDHPEWLYDVTWLKYEGERPLIEAPFVAECEWSNEGAIKDDFEKLLLARSAVHLMVFDGGNQTESERIAQGLAKMVGAFKNTSVADYWLLAAWEGTNAEWSFRYFTIEPNVCQPVFGAHVVPLALS